jgi:ribonuclease HI
MIYADGSGWNGERSAWGLVLNDGRKAIFETDKKRTNNETEYLAVIAACDYVIRGEEILTDSRLVYGQINEKWKINHAHLHELYTVLKKRLSETGASVRWIPRKQNKAGKLFE